MSTGRWLPLLVAGALALAACSSGDDGARRSRPPTAPASDSSDSSGSSAGPSTSGATPTAGAAPAGLLAAYPCRGGFTCGTFEVPLDHADRDGATLELQVAVETDADAPRGVLLALNGGPGAAGAPLAPDVAERLGPDVVAGYRLVVLDQRGTGTRALDCPALQESAGRSYTPTASAVRACAGQLAKVAPFYGTDDVVADLDALRSALAVPQWSVFAVSYGTYVAQQYAAKHPGRVAGLVLDSPLPAAGTDVLGLDAAAASSRVLRLACRATRCAGDPVDDLATVVRRDGGGADLLALMRGMSSVRPAYDTLLAALRSAARGDRADLERLLQAYRTGFATTPEIFSAGLHSAAYCADQSFPWGLSRAPVRSRSSAVRAAVAGVGAVATYPFDRATLAGSSALGECRAWLPTEPSAVARGRVRLPRVPVLLLAGDRDLSAPVESVRGSAADRLPGAQLVVVRGAGHVVTAQSEKGRQVVRDFLLR